MIFLRFNSKRQQKVFWVVMVALIIIASLNAYTIYDKGLAGLMAYVTLFWLLFGAPVVRILLTDDKPKE
jgi:Na+/serine symporter